MAFSTHTEPVIPKGWMRALIFYLSYIALSILAGFLLGIVEWIKTEGATRKSLSVANKLQNGNMVILGLVVVFVLSLLLVGIFTRLIDRRSFTGLGLSFKDHSREALTGLCLSIALVCATSLLLYWNHNLRWTDITFNGRDLFIGTVLMALVAAGEELVFRGYILRNLMDSFEPRVALGISSLIFATTHLANPHVSLIAFINLVLAGLLLGINYMYTRNLGFSILFHFGWNFFQGPLLGFDVSGLNLHSVLQPQLQGNPILTGDGFGLEGSILTGIFSIVLLLILYWLYDSRFSGKTPALH